MSKNNSKNRKITKPKVNPLYTVNRRRSAPKVDFDGATLNFTQYFSNMTTVANQAAACFVVDCSNTNNTTVPNNTNHSPVTGYTGVTGVYSEFVYEKLTLHWQPFIGPGQAGAGSKVYVGYVDNPEVCTTLIGAGVSTCVAAVQGLRNAKSFNAWEQFTYNVPLTRRSKVFNVNTNIVYGADTCERSVQGVVQTGINGINAAETLGQWRVTGVVRLIGLQTQIVT